MYYLKVKSNGTQNIILKNLRLIKINMKDNHELIDFEHDGNFVDKFPAMVEDKLTAYFRQ